MTEYIKREDALDAIMGAKTEFARMGYFVPDEFTRNLVLRIKSAPVANVRENVLGKWKQVEAGIYRCSICNMELIGIRTRFCADCGADMRGGKNND